jgi:hypothetical protein
MPPKSEARRVAATNERRYQPFVSIERAAALYETWNSDGVDAVAAGFWAESITWHDDPGIPDAATYSGRDRVCEHIRDRVEVLGNFQIATERVADIGEGRVLVVYTVGGQGGRSGTPWEIRMAQTLTFLDDRVVEVQDHLDADAQVGQL